ncbi:amidohydrolase [Cytobacillus sp. IB215316]|uniref:amidohydrolase n=1 Tax=Cytobacillus sp. IB215316 TaxID=3097354 RepID=UPI002A15D034|nr:amidohydrolase [Cytobacillus sp. IB215316]MDX8359281.1 amidohydrolase [Cytobacillus sp. IB215316]
MGTLWFGGTIYTMCNENDKAEAVYVEEGMIKDIGSEEQLRKEYGEYITKNVDLQNAVMFPGFVDSHIHLIGLGEKLLTMDLSSKTTSDDIRTTLKEYVKSYNSGDWVIAEGWNENNLKDKKIFNRFDLDEISPNNPMVLKRICHHAAIVNSKALQLAGITAETTDPKGGVIVRNDKGEPTGYLLDKAVDLVTKAIPAVTTDYLNKALATSIDHCFSLGLVGAHTEDLNYYNSFSQTYETFLHVINGQSKKFRANLLVHHEVIDDMIQRELNDSSNEEFIKFGAMKIFADGALGGRTALLSEPYHDQSSTSGIAIHSQDELKELVKKARLYNMPVAIHVIGDLAFEYAISAIEAYPPPKGERDRLIHAQILRKELIERAKHLSVILDIQPTFVMSDFPWVIDRLGEDRMQYSYAWRTLIDEGFHCAGGSDAPIESANPLLGIYAAIMRKSPSDKHEGYYQDEKLTPFEAVCLYTRGSAYAVKMEQTHGKITPGFVADFTILDRDILQIDPEDIPLTNVVMTVVDNNIVYKSDTN